MRSTTQQVLRRTGRHSSCASCPSRGDRARENKPAWSTAPSPTSLYFEWIPFAHRSQNTAEKTKRLGHFHPDRPRSAPPGRTAPAFHWSEPGDDKRAFALRTRCSDAENLLCSRRLGAAGSQTACRLAARTPSARDTGQAGPRAAL